MCLRLCPTILWSDLYILGRISTCSQELDALSELSSSAVMKNAGWNLDVTVWQNDQADLLDKCRRGKNWFGYSAQPAVGNLSTSLRGSGEVTLDFGNCWDAGEVKVYLNDIEKASAASDTPSKIVTFGFNDGSTVFSFRIVYTILIGILKPGFSLFSHTFLSW